MCAVSMISDHYGDRFRDWQQQRPSLPEPIPWPAHIPTTLPWTQDALTDLKEILKRLAALDKKLGLENCEDPKKGEWMAEIERRLAALEAK